MRTGTSSFIYPSNKPFNWVNGFLFIWDIVLLIWFMLSNLISLSHGLTKGPQSFNELSLKKKQFQNKFKQTKILFEIFHLNNIQSSRPKSKICALNQCKNTFGLFWVSGNVWPFLLCRRCAKLTKHIYLVRKRWRLFDEI